MNTNTTQCAQLIQSVCGPLGCYNSSIVKFWEFNGSLWQKTSIAKTMFDFVNYLEKTPLNDNSYNTLQLIFKSNYITDEIPVKPDLMLHLQTGNMRVRTSNDYFSFEFPEYRQGFHYPLIDNYLDDLFLNNQELKDYLQIILGSSLTHTDPGNKLYIFHGRYGSEGKSTLLRLISDILNPVSMEMGLNPVANHGHPLKYQNRRFKYIREDDVLNTSHIKRIVSGDNENKGKVFLETNCVPHSKDLSVALRLEIIPFPTVFVHNPYLPHHRQRNSNIYNDIIKDELAVIALFSWLVDGAINFLNHPVQIPQCVVSATKDNIDYNCGIHEEI